MSIGRKKTLMRGIGEIFTFKKIDKDKEIKNMFTAISIMTLATGIDSIAQGLISATLISAKNTLSTDIYSYTQG